LQAVSQRRPRRHPPQATLWVREGWPGRAHQRPTPDPQPRNRSKKGPTRASGAAQRFLGGAASPAIPCTTASREYDPEPPPRPRTRPTDRTCSPTAESRASHAPFSAHRRRSFSCPPPRPARSERGACRLPVVVLARCRPDLSTKRTARCERRGRGVAQLGSLSSRHEPRGLPLRPAPGRRTRVRANPSESGSRRDSAPENIQTSWYVHEALCSSPVARWRAAHRAQSRTELGELERCSPLFALATIASRPSGPMRRPTRRRSSLRNGSRATLQNG
jgi:hypothetical protein